MDSEDIVALMMETIIELEADIQARPSGRRDRELTLQSSGFQIVQVETQEEALLCVRDQGGRNYRQTQDQSGTIHVM